MIACDTAIMPPKRPRDVNQLAKFTLDVATGEIPNDRFDKPSPQRAGGLKGGTARAKKLSPQERKTTAQKAAAARWRKRLP